MAESGRKNLVWDIRKSLLTLSAKELYVVAKDVGPAAGQDQPELEEGDQEGCFEHISSFMYSKHLLESEDSGMTELLILKDGIDAVIKNRDVSPVSDGGADLDSQTIHGPSQILYTSHNTGTVTGPPETVLVTNTDNATRPPQAADIVSHANSSDPLPSPSNTFVAHSMSSGRAVPDVTNVELQEMLSSYEELGRRLRQSMLSPAEQAFECSSSLPAQTAKSNGESIQYNQSMAMPSREGIISLRDLPYLQRREFKIQGGQVGDNSSDISYNNICKQIDEGLREGLHGTEVVRGVLRIIKPGVFKDMLINKDDLTVSELKGFLQAHLREKNSTELFQELMCARQDENETPQQFLYRVIGLKQRVLFTSKLPDTGIQYSPATVQDVFQHTIYQGLGNKYSDIRRELKPLLSSAKVNDETILRHVMRITNEENERQKRVGSSRRQAPTSAHSAQLQPDVTYSRSDEKESAAVKTKSDQIKQLTDKVEELTSLVESMRRQCEPQSVCPVPQHIQNRSRIKRDKPFGCTNCVQQNRTDCCHCFLCGEEGHRAVGCLKRQKSQGNMGWSLQRGTQ